MTTTREQLIEKLIAAQSHVDGPPSWSTRLKCLEVVGITTESLIALANGGVVVPGHLSGITDAIQNAGNIRIWNNINDRDGHRIEVKFAAKDTK